MNNEIELKANECIEEVAENGKLSTKLGKVDFKKIGTIGICAAAAAGIVAVTVVAVRKNKDKLSNLKSKLRGKKRRKVEDAYDDTFDVEISDHEFLSENE